MAIIICLCDSVDSVCRRVQFCTCVCGGSNGLSSIDGSMVVKSSPDKTIRHRKHSGCCRSGGLIPDELTFHIRQGTIIRPFMPSLLITTSDQNETNTLLIETVNMPTFPEIAPIEFLKFQNVGSVCGLPEGADWSRGP